MMNNENKGMILGALGVICFALTLPATRYISPHFDPMFISFGRITFAAILAIPLLLLSKKSLPTKAQLLQLIAVSAGVVIGFPFFTSLAMQTVPANHGSIILAILPLATAIFGTLLSNERPSWGFWLISIISCILICYYTFNQGAGSFHIGDIYLLLAVISAGIGYAFGGRLAKKIGGKEVISWALLLGLPISLGPTWTYLPDDLASYGVNIWASFFYLCMFSQLLGFIFWYNGLALGGIIRISQIQLLQTFVTITASSILLNEVIDNESIVFAIIIVIFVAVGRKMPINIKVITKETSPKVYD